MHWNNTRHRIRLQWGRKRCITRPNNDCEGDCPSLCLWYGNLYYSDLYRNFFPWRKFTLAGNIFSIFTFWKHRAELKRTSYLLVNLAVADLLVTVDISFLVGSGIKYLTTKRVIQDDWLFIMIFALDAFFRMALLLSLLVVALERHYVVRWPFRHLKLNTRSYIVNILFIWLTAAGCVFLYLETIYNHFQLGFACPLTLV